MTFTNAAIAFAVFKNLSELTKTHGAPDFQTSQRCPVLRFNARADLDEILRDRFQHMFRIAEGLIGAGDGNPSMKFSQLLRQPMNMFRMEFVARQHPAEPHRFAGNWTILTAYSMASPVPPSMGAEDEPVMGTTSRYSKGASRRFRRNSSWQKKRRFSRVLKSRTEIKH